MSFSITGPELANLWLQAGELAAINKLPPEQKNTVYDTTLDTIQAIKQMQDPEKVQTIFHEFISTLALPNAHLLQQEMLANMLLGDIFTDPHKKEGDASAIFKKLVKTLHRKSELPVLDEATTCKLNQVRMILNKQLSPFPNDVLNLIGTYAKNAILTEIPDELRDLLREIKREHYTKDSKLIPVVTSTTSQKIGNRIFYSLNKIHSFESEQRLKFESYKKLIEKIITFSNLSENLKIKPAPPLFFKVKRSFAEKISDLFKSSIEEKYHYLIFQHLPQIRNLIIDLNGLEDDFKINDYNLSLFPHLKRLYIKFSSLGNVFKTLKNLSHLQKIYFKGGDISADLLHSLPNSLNKISFDTAENSEDIFIHSPLMNNIRSLTIKGTNLTDEGVLGLAKKFPRLRKLVLTGSTINNCRADILANLPKSLSQLSLINSTTITDDDVKKLPTLKKLRILSLKNTEVTNACILELANKFPNLRKLKLSDCSISKCSEATLAKLPKFLNHLVLSRTPFSSADIENLPNLQHLQILELEKSAVTNACILKIKENFPQLHTLNLAGCNITNDAIQNLNYLRKLNTLHLNSTQITAEGIKNKKVTKLNLPKNLETLFLSKGCEDLKLEEEFPLCNFVFK